MSRLRKAFLILIGLFLVGGGPSWAQVQTTQTQDDLKITIPTVRSKAKPDECWAFLASPSPMPPFTNPANCASYPTPPGMPKAKPKVNESYIWGLTETGDHLWFGTISNTNCMGHSLSVPGNPTNPQGSPNAYATESFVCEFYTSPYYPAALPDARIADFRPSRFYQYSKSTRTTVEKTPKYPVYVNSITNPEGLLPLVNLTRGIRAAVTYNGIVLLAGPTWGPASLTFFAFDANTGAFLGARLVFGYNNIRSFLNLDGVLYTAVGKNQCSSPTSCTATIIGGRVLRLNPTKIPGCTFEPTTINPGPPPCWELNGTNSNPTEVGDLDTVGGSLATHNGRIYTITWPTGYLPNAVSSLYVSPAIPSGGLTIANANEWRQVWKASDYEPDQIQAMLYGGGAMVSYEGYFWWGTMHIPMQAFALLLENAPPTNAVEMMQALIGTQRATTIFRGKDLETSAPKIDIVYGNEKLPVFTPASNGVPAKWSLQTNKMPNPKSLHGPSGFGNLWNNYLWTATVWDGRLWFGTMDWSMSAVQAARMFSLMIGQPLPQEMLASGRLGADFFYMTGASRPALPESTNGVGNTSNTGIRNQLASTNGNLFLGTANPSNLLTDPTDPKHFGGLGGWELIELSRSPSLNTPIGTNVTVNLANGSSVTYCNVSVAGKTISTTVASPFLQIPINPLLAPYDLDGPTLPPGITKPPANLTQLWTSALWGQGCSSSTVSIPITGDMTAPRLLQLQWDGAQYSWRDITTSVNFPGKKITGTVSNDYLGILGVAQAEPPALTASVTGIGTDPVKGFFVDLRISSVGKAPALNIAITDLTLRTLTGTGTVSYNTAAGTALPIAVGSLAPESRATVRLFIKSTSAFGAGGVTRFSIAEHLRMQNAFGNTYTSVPAQLITPQ